MSTLEFLDLDEQIGDINTEPVLYERPVVRLSHSTRNLLRGCERKFYLTRYKKLDSLADVIPKASSIENNEHLDFGDALGIGLQKLLITNGNVEAACWSAIYAFRFANETDNKNILSLITGIRSFHEQWNYDEWEVVHYNGKPAAELSFKIILNEESGDYTCGRVDLIMRNKITGLASIIEIKTTGVRHDNIKPMFKNSDQGTGYSVVLDAIEHNHTTFHILYLVLHLKYNDIRPTWHTLPFLKSKKDKLEFLIDQHIDYEYLCKLEEIDHWPMRGNHCMVFGKVCHLFGICSLETLRELPFQPPKKEDDWDFVFTLQELIDGETTS